VPQLLRPQLCPVASELHMRLLEDDAMEIIGATKLELLFRRTAGIDMDKGDAERTYDLMRQKLRDLLIMAEATAKANGRDLIAPQDLPITRGLDENIDRFKKLTRTEAEFAGFGESLERMAPLPMLDLGYSADLEQGVQAIDGGLAITIARAFRALDPDLKTPLMHHWDRLVDVFDVVL
jgi:hypothetical protein